MTNPCGKQCTDCPVREEIGCAGCQSVVAQTGCGIAECAAKNNHESCATCTLRVSCPDRRNAPTMHIRRRNEAEEAARKQERIRAQAGILGRWMSVMFWLMIFRLPFSLAADLTEKLPVPHLILNTVMGILGLLYAFCLWKIRETDSRYAPAALMYAAGTVLNLLGNAADAVHFPGARILRLLFLLAAAVLMLMALYRTYIAHSWVTADLDGELSEDWERLWKWEIIQLVGSLFSPVLAYLGLLGILTLFALFIFSVIVDVLAFVYLYRSAQLFRDAA